jgi:tetratricopeptide (TPR) repeat protein
LPIRANAGPDLNIGNPKTMHDFLWVVLRNLYQYPVKTNPDVYANQIIVFLKFFFTNYSLFILFGFIGLRTMLKTERKSAWFLLSVFLLYIIVVVPYTRTIKGIFILENILLIPAEYVCVLFIASGMFHIFSKARENKIYIYGFIALTAGLFGFMSFRHYEINNHSEDYITYDLGKSILNTMEKDSVYFGDGDYNIMPVYYLQQMNNEKSDIKLVASMFINYQWGIDNFTKKYGSISISPMNLGDNIRIVIDSFVNKANIYRSSLYPKFDEIDLPYKQLQKGLLIKITPENEMFSSEIFDIYCYRGIFNKFCQSDQAKLDIITWYAKGMVNQGNDLNNSGKLTEALKLYERALLFPVKKPEADIYYSMSIAYSKLQDVENELVCLEKSIQENNNYLPALEKAGVIYYERKILPMAGNMFDRAVMAGSKSDYILNAAKHISTMNFTDQCEYGFIKANEYLLKNDVKKAMYIYNFLIGNNYKTGIIQANIGNFYFNNDNYPEALRWLLKSQNSMKSPGMVYCIAYSYYRIKDIKSALRVLEEGLKTYNEDQRLKTFYSQLKHI